MKFFSALPLLVVAIAHSVSAHCTYPITDSRFHSNQISAAKLDIWHTLIAGNTQSTAAVRQPINNSPVEDVTSPNIRCNINTPATQTVSVAAGSTIGFILDNTLYHSGPAAIYLGKAPGSVASWDGSGANWFKVCQTRNGYQRQYLD